MGVRPDHQGVMDLLAAYGIDTERMLSVCIRASVGDSTTVDIEYVVHDADLTRIARRYDVTVTEVDR